MFVDKKQPTKQDALGVKQVSVVIRKPNLDLKNNKILPESVKKTL
jgi:hypothetical protein